MSDSTEAVLEAAFQAGLTKLYAETNWVEVAPHLQADMRVLLNAASVVLLADKEREIERLKGEVMECTKCAYTTSRLHESVCPNDGTALVPMTWKDRAMFAIDKANAAEAEAQKLREALKEAATLCWCGGTGLVAVDCTLCGDSTFDHDCNDKEVPCTKAACVQARKALGGS